MNANETTSRRRTVRASFAATFSGRDAALAGDADALGDEPLSLERGKAP